LNGIITQNKFGNYDIPKNLKTLNYRTGSSPLLPYSYRNILNADLRLSHSESLRKCIGFGEFMARKENGTWKGDNVENICKDSGKFEPEQQESANDDSEYDLPFKTVNKHEVGVKIKSTTFGEFGQWSS
jgi:hypothetical protein